VTDVPARPVPGLDPSGLVRAEDELLGVWASVRAIRIMGEALTYGGGHGDYVDGAAVEVAARHAEEEVEKAIAELRKARGHEPLP